MCWKFSDLKFLCIVFFRLTLFGRAYLWFQTFAGGLFSSRLSVCESQPCWKLGLYWQPCLMTSVHHHSLVNGVDDWKWLQKTNLDRNQVINGIFCSWKALLCYWPPFYCHSNISFIDLLAAGTNNFVCRSWSVDNGLCYIFLLCCLQAWLPLYSGQIQMPSSTTKLLLVL